MTMISWTMRPGIRGSAARSVSPGCTHCYAMRDAWRISHSTAAPWYRGTVRLVHGKPVWTGAVHRAAEHKFAEPLRWARHGGCS